MLSTHRLSRAGGRAARGDDALDPLVPAATVLVDCRRW
jgi:hypothetical protein